MNYQSIAPPIYHLSLRHAQPQWRRLGFLALTLVGLLLIYTAFSARTASATSTPTVNPTPTVESISTVESTPYVPVKVPRPPGNSPFAWLFAPSLAVFALAGLLIAQPVPPYRYRFALKLLTLVGVFLVGMIIFAIMPIVHTVSITEQQRHHSAAGVVKVIAQQPVKPTPTVTHTITPTSTAIPAATPTPMLP